MPLSVFACITPKAEHFEDAKSAISAILDRTRSEHGCRLFMLHEDGERCGRLFLFEMWDDDAALQRHYEQPYTREVFAAYEDWLAEPVAITKMTPVG